MFARQRPPKKWVQTVIRKPGALRAYVLRRFGKNGFDFMGRIRIDVLQHLAQEPGTVGQRARLALTLRGY